jgi:chromosome segregation ATPase
LNPHPAFKFLKNNNFPNGTIRAESRAEVFPDMIEHTDHSRQPIAWLLILSALVLAAGGYSIYLGTTQAQDLRRQIADAKQDNTALRANLADTSSQLQGAMDSLREDVSKVEQDANTGVAKAQSAATRHADMVASKLAKKAADDAEQLSAELNKVKDSTADAAGRIDGITTDVGAVKTDVASTKSTLEETRSDLQRVRGDMGVTSGLVATNSKQIQELRDLGDRNIYEFTLAKNGKTQKVGDIELILRKADTGHNRFTVDVLADDKRVEKKDRTVNEPVQFYTLKAHQPYELVVNQIGKNQVTGYLATPKVTIARN